MLEQKKSIGQPLIAEIVGPAGVGKTTLLRAMQQQQKISSDIYLSKTKHLYFLIQQTSIFLPTYLKRFRNTRWFSASEMRSMVYFTGWHKFLEKNSYSNYSTVILDHGPIFRLASLHEFGPGITKYSSFKKWWDNLLEKWMHTLDLIIWLDAEDELLLERIENRSRHHSTKGKSSTEKSEFLFRYRRSYQQIMKKMTSPNGPILLSFDTGQKSPQQIALEVLVSINKNEIFK